MQLYVQSDHLIESKFFSKNPHVINLEDSLLDLTLSTAVDGIFYCCSMKISIGDKLLHVARFFEYGAFAGLFSSKGHDTLKEYLQLDQLLPYSVYVEKDVKANRERAEEFYEKRKKPGSLFPYTCVSFLFSYFLVDFISYTYDYDADYDLSWRVICDR